MADHIVGPAPLGPWNPGIQSKIPRVFLPLATVFSQHNSMVSLSESEDLSDYCGLLPEKISPLRPERLILHEILIRVMVELTVPNGDSSGELGVNFRTMTAVIMRKYIGPELSRLCGEFHAMRDDITVRVASAAERVSQSAPRYDRALETNRLWRFWRRRQAVSAAGQSAEEASIGLLARWEAMKRESESDIERACMAALIRAGSAVFARRGAIQTADSAMRALAVTLVCNEYGSETIGRMIEPLFEDAVRREGFRYLPNQARPLIMNTKGASASGKSTMRPLQRRLASRVGVDWQDFAIISPDIWRKYLLDYGSLGSARRYAGALTAHEVEIIDTKLDRHMRHRARAGRMTHLLIDRFRFDSFSSGPNGEDSGHLLTRFGDTVYLFFMITPPEATIERAWVRGELVGRYKAVDDLLAHNVEAYCGIPALFFRWAGSVDKAIHYEFLDNDVPEGCRPFTVAFGVNGAMKILDLEKLMNIDRYQKINIDATGPESIYPDRSIISPQRNVEFFRQCIRKFPSIEFADRDSGWIYARIEQGKLTYWNETEFSRAVADADAREAFRLIADPPAANGGAGDSVPPRLVVDEWRTIGRWGHTASQVVKEG